MKKTRNELQVKNDATAFELLKASQLLEQIQELSKIGHWELDIINEKIYWSKETRAIHEVPDDYAPNLNEAINFYDELSLPIITSIVKNAIDKRDKWDVKLGINTAKGNHKWVRATGKVYEENGEVTKLFGIFQDITEEKRKLDELLQRENTIAELNSDLEEQISKRNEELKESKHKFQKLYDFAPEMMLSVDAKTGKIVECNLTTCNKLGYSKQELIGKSVAEIYHEDTRKKVEMLFGKFKRVGKLSSERLVAVSKEGELINVALSAIAVRDEGGNIVKSNSILKDITSLVKVEKKLKAINSDLEKIVQSRTEALVETSKELEEFTYIATHDLKSPLANIKGHLEILLNELGNTNKMIDRSIHWIADSVENAERKIQGIINVARIKSANIEELMPVRLIELAKQVKENLPSGEREAINSFQIQAKKEIELKSNRLYLETILNNLIGNAVKYRKIGEKVAIVVAIEEKGDDVSISITDNGLGIDMERDRPKLFKMFHRLHDHIEGNGIGLYLVLKMIENLGGKIDVSSTLEKGTTFVISLQNVKKENGKI